MAIRHARNGNSPETRNASGRSSRLIAFVRSREGRVAGLCLLVVALAAAITWRNSSKAPEVSPPTAQAATPASAPASAPAAATAPAGSPPQETSTGAPISIAQPAPKAAAQTDEQIAATEKLELAKSTWVGVWGRQLPDPNAIDMDLSHMKEPGGKAIPIPYVAPKPMTNGTFITNANGTMSQVIDNRVVNPDGTTATIKGDKLMRSDGALGVMVGDQILWSDGTKSGY